MAFILNFFLQAISLREMEDVASLEEMLGRPLSKQERSRIGVSSLRIFLEELLQKRYKDFYFAQIEVVIPRILIKGYDVIYDLYATFIMCDYEFHWRNMRFGLILLSFHKCWMCL